MAYFPFEKLSEPSAPRESWAATDCDVQSLMSSRSYFGRAWLACLTVAFYCFLSIGCFALSEKDALSQKRSDISSEIKKAAEDYFIKPIPANAANGMDYYIVRVNGISPTRIDDSTYIVDVDVTRHSGEADIVRIVCRRYVGVTKFIGKETNVRGACRSPGHVTCL
jgi:hypothetical protein